MKRLEQSLMRSGSENENGNQSGPRLLTRIQETAWTKRLLKQERKKLRPQDRKRNGCEPRSLRALLQRAKRIARKYFANAFAFLNSNDLRVTEKPHLLPRDLKKAGLQPSPRRSLKTPTRKITLLLRSRPFPTCHSRTRKTRVSNPAQRADRFTAFRRDLKGETEYNMQQPPQHQKELILDSQSIPTLERLLSPPILLQNRQLLTRLSLNNVGLGTLDGLPSLKGLEKVRDFPLSPWSVVVDWNDNSSI